MPAPGPQSTLSKARVQFEKACADYFFFLRFWKCKNRETGEVMRLAPENLWPGQRQFAEAMREHNWIIALKAGKLGFTEVECSFDGWKLIRHHNARVHLFSKDQPASYELLKYVRYGIMNLPKSWGITLLKGEAGGDSARSFMFNVGVLDDPADVRTCFSYPAKSSDSNNSVAIDVSAIHSHVDELAHMPDPKGLWESVSTTVSPYGTCHIVSRGAGDNHMATLYRQAKKGATDHGMYPLFVDYQGRPDRDEGWRANQELLIGTIVGAQRFAPRTDEDALQPDRAEAFIQQEWWDVLHRDIAPLHPGDSTPLVMGVDAATTGDCFAIVLVSRDPENKEHVLVRAVKVWDPREEGGAVDYDEAEEFIRFTCGGGHIVQGRLHARSNFKRRLGECEACAEGVMEVEGLNVKMMAYDPYQLDAMAQRLTKDSVTWCYAFAQGQPRLVADRGLYDAIINKTVWHPGTQKLREHVLNAGRQVAKNEDSKMRIIKLEPTRKIDACVALSMANDRCRWINI